MNKILVFLLFLALVGTGSYLLAASYQQVFNAKDNQAVINDLPAADFADQASSSGSGVVFAAASGGSNNNSAPSGITMAVLASHSSSGDCWMAVAGKVYNLTSYLTKHPGGASAITSYCGKDGTVAFATKGGSGLHSAIAANLLAKYLIGILVNGAASSSAAINASTAQASTVANSDSKAIGSAAANPSSLPQSPVLVQNVPVASVALTSTEVGRHNTSSDCWVIISSSVYNLTNFIRSHPGGAAAISALCGTDGTAAFSGQHTSSTLASVSAYRIGSLNQSVSVPQPGAGTAVVTAPPAPAPTASTVREDRDEDEEEHD